jgi:outer membrane autotransporter protein
MIPSAARSSSRFPTASLLATPSVTALLFATPTSAIAGPGAGQAVTGQVMSVTNPAGQSITSILIVNASVAGAVTNAGTITPGKSVNGLTAGIVAAESTVGGGVLNSGTIAVIPQGLGIGILLIGSAVSAGRAAGAVANDGTITVDAKNSAAAGLLISNSAIILDVTGGALSFQPKSTGNGLSKLDQTGGNVVLQVTTSTSAGQFPTVNVGELTLTGVLEVGPQAGTFAAGQTITYPNVFTAGAITNDITSVKVFDFFSTDVRGSLTAGNKGPLSVTLTNTGKMALTPGAASGAGTFIGLTNPLGAILPAISVTNGASVNGGITNAGFIGVPGTPQPTGILVSGGQLSQPITNTGTIAGTTASVDVSKAAAATSIIQSAGTIMGAIKLSPHADTLTINGGTILGDITGTGASGTVMIAPTNNADNTFTYANTLSGVATIDIGAGANFALAPQGAISNTGTLVLATTSRITGAGSITQSGMTVLQFVNNTAAGAYPTINATTILLSGKLQVVLTGAFPGSGMQDFVKVLSATGSLTNNIAAANVSVSTNGATLPAGTNVTARLVQGANSADVVVVETPTANAQGNATKAANALAPGGFVMTGLTRNEAAVANALNAVLLADTPFSQGLLSALLHSNPATLPRSFDALSGEIHASVVTVGFDDLLLTRSAILGHLSEPIPPASLAADARTSAAIAAGLSSGEPPNRAPIDVLSYQPRMFDLWGQGFGDWSHVKSDSNAAPLSRATGGFVLGGDVTALGFLGGDWRFGIAGGVTDDRVTVSQRLSSTSFESAFGGIYAGARFGAVELRAGALYGASSTSTTRSVILPGFVDALSSSQGGVTPQAFGEAGYRVELTNAVFGGVGFSGARIEPFAGAAAILIRQNGFTEGGGASALTGFGRDFDIGTTTLGVRSVLEFASLPVSVTTMLGWRHAFGDVVPSVLLGFQGGAQSFTVAGGPIDRDAFVAEAGMKYAVSSRLSVGLSYAGQIGQRGTANAFKARIDVRF